MSDEKVLTRKKHNKNEVTEFYLKNTRKNKIGQRLEKARIYAALFDSGIAKDRTAWCHSLHIARALYAQVIRNEKPIPMTVWPALYEMGFSLDWFMSGEGDIFRGKKITIIDSELNGDIK